MSADPHTMNPVRPTPRRLDDVPGWFWPVDQLLFTRILEGQTDADTTGDLLELGTYLGRSAILIGRHLQAGESFTICDLFDSDAPDEANSDEMSMSYRKTLTRQAFEANYLAFHPELPTVVQAPTSVLQDGRVAAESCRFVHIDASHLYEHVAGDVQVARAALGKNGVVVFDDYRSAHTPGTAAAVWEAVFSHGLRPVCLSPEKFYGTWGDPAVLQEMLLGHDWTGEGWDLSRDTLAGGEVLRLSGKGLNLADPEVRARAAARPAVARSAARGPVPGPRSVGRRLAIDLLPPMATRAVRRRLQAARDRRAG
ncbi:class I SAM-dependent methyltransferase [Kitasatospora sp. NBC_00240]|uniref:class I SAM-dependent methyltransferase n=1 Tax=Kitasatospora sp. NBC_00240 TaxID=2903567 RepID=UPI00225707DE|nr:class I SAM-dependent methyltransferase [Kitasatospora sp. NBC_00240]MCX5212490.1 class I SAM-dependent methyltransferase [Kitasatospora sp. NBC_00240]